MAERESETKEKKWSGDSSFRSLRLQIACEQQRYREAESRLLPSPMANRPGTAHFGQTALEDRGQDEWEHDEPLYAAQGIDGDGDDDEHQANADRDSLYATLNLERDASEDEIQKAYRRLAGEPPPPDGPQELRANLADFRAALLHPDRHRDPALKPAADARFAALQRGYEILSDPAKRAIYDEFGESGLKTQWEVSTKGKTPAEVCAHSLPTRWGKIRLG